MRRVLVRRGVGVYVEARRDVWVSVRVHVGVGV